MKNNNNFLNICRIIGWGFTGLFIILLILKLTNIISWGWIWVFAPWWIPISICLIAISGFLITDLYLKKKPDMGD